MEVQVLPHPSIFFSFNCHKMEALMLLLHTWLLLHYEVSGDTWLYCMISGALDTICLLIFAVHLSEILA